MMGMDHVSPAEEHLQRLGIPYRLHRHNQPVRSLAQAAAERGMAEDQIVRSLVFRLENGSFVLVLMPGPSQVAWGKLRHFLGVSRITTASADEVLEVTGYRPGTVSPFGLATPLKLLADDRLRTQDEISVGAGIGDAGLILDTADLVAALSPAFGDFGGD
jgi:Cys-tRNA(Pro)/Cys-tRNA(Cys) deacylase